MSQVSNPKESNQPNDCDVGDQSVVTSHGANRIGYELEHRPSKVSRHHPVSAYQDGHEVIRIDDGESHWVVAESITEALHDHGVESLGYATVKEYCDDMGPIRVKRLYPHEKIKVTYDDGKVVERKACEWAVDHRGVLCSTNW